MRHGYLFPILVTLALVGAYGCGDDVTDPDAFLESAEAEAVMQSARGLPMLPDLTERAATSSSRDRAVLQRAREMWAAGASGDEGIDSSHRRLAVRYALPVLVERLPAEYWGEVREGVDDWIGTAESMLQHLELARVRDRVEAARRYLARSDASQTDERRRSYYLMLAMSELVETTPRSVAAALVRDASAALEGSAGAEGERAVKARDRAGRLKEWAERAVAEGDYLLAIQRAYYAIQLVERP